MRSSRDKHTQTAIPFIPHRQYDWIRSFRYNTEHVTLDIAGDRTLICGNADGFLLLASRCITFAQPAINDSSHIHLDAFSFFEPGCKGSFTILRNKEIVDGRQFISEKVALAFGGDAAVDELVEIGDTFLRSDPEAASTTGSLETEDVHAIPQLPMRDAFVEYTPCDADGVFEHKIEIEGYLLMKVDDDDAYFEGDDLGLLSLASIFVSMAQPNMPEEGMLILDADAFAPGSYGHLELMRIDTWPQWNLTRSDAIPEAFRQDKD